MNILRDDTQFIEFFPVMGDVFMHSIDSRLQPLQLQLLKLIA
jgi:hypothetical protein